MPQRRNCRQSNIGLTQNTERHLAEALGVGGAAAHHAADHALPDVRFERAVDRHRRGLGDFREQLIGKDHAPLGHWRVAHVQDQAVGGQRLQRRQHPGQRRLVAVGDRHTRREGSESRFDALAESGDRRRISHHVQTLRAWMELEREIQRLGLRRFAHDAGDAVDLFLQERGRRRRGCKEDWQVRKQLVPMPEHELQRRRGVRDHQVELPIGKLDADGVGQRRVRCLPEFLVLQVLRVGVHLDRGVREQGLAQRRVQRCVSRECRRTAVNDQHALDRALGKRGRPEREARDDHHGHETAAGGKANAHQNDSFAAS